MPVINHGKNAVEMMINSSYFWHSDSKPIRISSDNPYMGQLGIKNYKII